MDLQQIRVTTLPDNNSLQNFRCGVREIDKWASEKAHKFHAQNRTKVFCATEEGSTKTLGFYALSFSSETAEKLTGQYKDIYRARGVPLVYISYLAVSSLCQNQRLGTFLLLDALWRAHLVAQHIAFFGVALRSLNERTTQLYEKYGFGRKEDDPDPLMILPVWSLYDLFSPPSRSS